jgi:hypothetical protein
VLEFLGYVLDVCHADSASDTQHCKRTYQLHCQLARSEAPCMAQQLIRLLHGACLLCLLGYGVLCSPLGVPLATCSSLPLAVAGAQ